MSKARDYFVPGGFNCAETVFYVLAEKGVSGAQPECVRILTGLGGGLSRNLICGAVLGAVTSLSWAYGRTDLSESREPAKEVVQLFLDRFKEEYGELNCRDLRVKHLGTDDLDAPERRPKCLEFVNRAIEIATEIAAEKAKA
jgi:C_GCAxxG_C_C family probable redox protein